jgi:hypothetical protein
MILSGADGIPGEDIGIIVGIGFGGITIRCGGPNIKPAGPRL